MMKSLTLLVLLFQFTFTFAQTPWKTRNTNSKTKGSFTGIAFPKEDNGFMVGDSATFLLTKDGGKTWKADSLESVRWDNQDFLDILFLDNNLGFTATKYAVYKTKDCGENWSKIDFLPNKYYGIGIFDSTLFIYGDYAFGQLFMGRYSPSQDTFAMSVGFFPLNSIEKVQYIGDSNVIIAKESGKLYHSNDLGKTLTEVYNPTDDGLSNLKVNDIYFKNKDTGFACFNYILLKKTTDGGNSWFTDTTMRFNKATSQTHKFSFANGKIYLTGRTFNGALSIFYHQSDKWHLDTTIGSLNWGNTAGVAGNSMGLFAPISNESFAYKTKWDQINSTIIKNNKPTFDLYPNPNNGKFFIKYNPSQHHTNSSITIYNNLGEKIKEMNLNNSNNTIEIQKSGIYHVTLFSNGKVQNTRSIVIQ